MLQITEAATEVIRGLRAQSEADDVKAVRIQLVPGEEQSLGLSFAAGPRETDEPIAQEPDIEVYLSEDLVEPLSDAVIDAETTPQGAQLTVRQQEQTS